MSDNELDFNGLDMELVASTPQSTEKITPEIKQEYSTTKQCPTCGHINIYDHCASCNRHHPPEYHCAENITKEQIKKDNSTPSNSALNVGLLIEHTARINHFFDELVQGLSTNDALKVYEQRIELYKQKMELIRLEQMEAHKRRNKIINMQVADDVENLRRDNPSRSAIRAEKSQKRTLNQIEKNVISWIKMNWKMKQILFMAKEVHAKELTENYVKQLATENGLKIAQ